MKKRYILISLGLAVGLLGACSQLEETSTSTAQPTNTDSPRIHVLVDDHEIKTKQVADTFDDDKKEREAEKSVESVAHTMEAVVSEPNSLVQVYAEPQETFEKLFVRQWDNHTAKMVKTDENRFALPSQPGTYVYEVMSYYTNGDMQHVFTITVE